MRNSEKIATLARTGFGVLAFLGATLVAAPSNAAIVFINNTPNFVNVAIALKDFSDGGGIFDGCNTRCDPHWNNRGWFVVNPGGQKVVANEDAEEYQKAFMAWDPVGHIWVGNTAVLCTDMQRAFDFCGSQICNSQLSMRGYRGIGGVSLSCNSFTSTIQYLTLTI